MGQPTNVILASYYKGKRLYVSQAPDPEKIIWENIKYSQMERIVRQFVTLVCGAVLVGLCMVMVSVTVSYDMNALDKGGREPCPEGFDSWPEDKQNRYTDRNPETLHCLCDTDAGTSSDCEEYIKALSLARFFRAFTAICCSFSAAAVDGILLVMLPFEKHIAMDSQEKSLMLRSVFLKTILYGTLQLSLQQLWPLIINTLLCRRCILVRDRTCRQ